MRTVSLSSGLKVQNIILENAAQVSVRSACMILYPERARDILVTSLCCESKSDRQEGPVVQNQICQRELHVKFGFLFSSTIVSYLAKAKQALQNPENMLNFCPNRGFLPITPFDLTCGTHCVVFALGWPTVAFVMLFSDLGYCG